MEPTHPELRKARAWFAHHWILTVVSVLFLVNFEAVLVDPSARYYALILVVASLLLYLLPWFGALWSLFRLFGQPRPYAIVPIWNTILLARIAGQRWWWGLLALVPGIHIVALYRIGRRIVARLGRAPGLAIGVALLPFVFYPVLIWLVESEPQSGHE